MVRAAPVNSSKSFSGGMISLFFGERPISSDGPFILSYPTIFKRVCLLNGTNIALYSANGANLGAKDISV